MLNFFNRLLYWLEPKRRKDNFFKCGHCCICCNFYRECSDEFYALDLIRESDFKKPLKITIDNL